MMSTLTKETINEQASIIRDYRDQIYKLVRDLSKHLASVSSSLPQT